MKKQNEYNTRTSFHYAKYRPPLHKLILEKGLHPQVTYAYGLDVGCGTGHSCIALSHYCEKVIGIDPSRAMIKNAIEHPKVEYIVHSNNCLPFENDSFDIISFAGSLYYAKSQDLLDEVLRLSKDAATIIVYDFNICLDEILTQVNIDVSLMKKSDYNHKEDFSGLRNAQLIKLKSSQESLAFSISPLELAHLILSSRHNFLMLMGKYGVENIDHSLGSMLATIGQTSLYAHLYYTVYSVNKTV